MQSLPLDMVRFARPVALAAFCVLVANSGFADDNGEAQSSIKARLNAAQMVYEHLLERHRTGKRGGVESIESRARWSERIVALEMEQASAEMGAGLSGLRVADVVQQKTQQALRRHIERMQVLAKQASARVDAGVASTSEAAAARYFALEAECLPEKVAELQRVQEERELDVMLPPASEARPLTVAPKELFINIDVEGIVFIDGKKLTTQQLDKTLASYMAANPVAARVIIRADERTELQDVVRVMNLCNRHSLDYSLTAKSD